MAIVDKGLLYQAVALIAVVIIFDTLGRHIRIYTKIWVNPGPLEWPS